LEFAYPFRIDKNGRTALTASEADHIEQMVEQVLFTDPGERVNRPTFGAGINRLVFAPLSNELVAASQALVQASLQQWLGDIIVVNSVEASSQESTLLIQIVYTIKETQQTLIAKFAREI
jgi:uncharacterized protein